MGEIKTILGIIAVVLTFIGYIPYLKDIIKGKTQPHIYSWFLWGFVTIIAFALQFSDHAGAGAFVSLAAGIMCFVVVGLSLFQKSKKDIAILDTIFLFIAIIALIVWIYAKQPVFSILLITFIDLCGFIPTIRKSWNKPHTETLSFYLLNTFRFALAVLALQNFTIITALYPITWAAANGGFSIMLIVRRRFYSTQ